MKGLKDFIVRHFSFERSLSKRVSLIMLISAIAGNIVGSFESLFIDLPIFANGGFQSFIKNRQIPMSLRGFTTDAILKNF